MKTRVILEEKQAFCTMSLSCCANGPENNNGAIEAVPDHPDNILFLTLHYVDKTIDP